MASLPRLVTVLLTVAAAAVLGCGTPAMSETTDRELIAPPTPYPRPIYAMLSETGLYSSQGTDDFAHGVTPFEPNFRLWSDGAEKQRFAALPAGTLIDTTDMDHWQFPVGTRFWKEFSRDGIRLETRVIERYGEGPDDYWMGAFIWNGDQSDAAFSESGQADVAGTTHDVPASTDCHTCHNGEAGRVLGFSALQLADTGSTRKPGVRLDDLVAYDRLTVPPSPTVVRDAMPGDTASQAAIGYLHANCGHCHNPNGFCAYPGMTLRHGLGERKLEETALFQTAVGHPTMFDGVPAAYRVAPGAPSESAIVQYMQARGNVQMPPMATELVDSEGVALVSAWIASMPPEPAALPPRRE